MAFSTKERAVTATPKLMDDHCTHGEDWRNGLKGFSRKKKEKYLGYEYFGDEVGQDGGLLISNESNEDIYDHASVLLERLQLDPPDAGNETPFVDEGESSDDDDDDDDDGTCHYSGVYGNFSSSETSDASTYG